MKIKKLIILLISIIVPLTITILIALYSYGTIGEWTGNQEKYVNELFYKDQTNEKSISNYLKFNSEKYKNHSSEVKLYKDYTADSLETITADNGVFKLDDLSFSLYTLLSQDETYASYHYDFFYFGIDNTEVTPENIVIIFVEEENLDSVDNLKVAVEQFSDEFIQSGEPSTYSSITTPITANVLFSTGANLTDVDGIGATNEDNEIETPYLYSSALRYQFVLEDEDGAEVSKSKTLTELDFCSFAMIELIFNDDDEADTARVLTTGQINNIEPDAERYIAANNDMLEGYGLDANKSLNKAGYFSYIWPTVLWQAGIAAVVTGLFGFLFFKTWTYDETPITKKTKR